MSSVSVQNDVSLRHCPFCGGVDVELQSQPFGDDLHTEWFVYCTRCEATGPISVTKKLAARVWNVGTGDFREASR